MAHRRLTRTATRAVVTALTTGALALAVAGPAAATTDDTTDGTVTITVDADAIAQLCDVRIPRALERAHDALGLIQAGPSTKGSAEWVRARAQQASAAGRDDLARRLGFRADQRLGHVDELEQLIAGLEQVDESICSQVTP